MYRPVIRLLLTCPLRVGLLLCSLVLFVPNSLGQDAAISGSERPNVIIIFIDDMGFGDVGFNGATGPKTPHLDQMAREGMQFRDFYVGCAVCSGSRTALMTGTHYQRLNMAAVLFPNSNKGLHPDEVTIADMLLDAGYATKCVGKWHLGHLPPCLPTYQGFQSYFGIPYSNDMWIDPANRLADDIVLREGVTLEQLRAGEKQKNQVPLMRDEEVIEYPVDQSTITKRYTEEAIRFIRQHRDEPFFLYLPHTMVHLPLAVSDAFKNRTGKLIWDAIEEVDWSVGEILGELRRAGLDERTLVIFTSDNGAAVGSSLPLRAKKGSVYDGGIREPTVMRWPGRIPAGTVCREVAASIDVLPTLAKLCRAELPQRPIDGHNIWSLMSGAKGATSPHQTYCLTHGPGTVRSGKWKYYPWPEGQSGRKADRSARDHNQGDRPSVQLYDTVADIGETRNVANEHPGVVQRLQAAWEAHNKELSANRRPAADLIRPKDALSPSRPGTPGRRSNSNVAPLDWATVEPGKTYPSSSVANLVKQPFTLTCKLSGDLASGVVVAHGGTLTGYSMYLHDGQLTFAVRQSGDTIRRVSLPLRPASDWTIVASVTPTAIRLKVNDNRAEVWQGDGRLLRHPAEDLSIAFDSKMPVDPKGPTRRFDGTIKSIRFQID
ncbi:sulfatase family protein [Roseiconus lacunae]|uniref:sulfatase family protein n=1 Tax=Roseiconus lacunae TaxID=2605694 RepID=UPI001E4C9D0D|nr:sulfatase [Roseiconus lacunae]MCD0463212.1 sulfatase [Roseiconus lacunae]